MTDTTLTRATLTLDLTGGAVSTGSKGPIPPGYYQTIIREAGVYSAPNGNQSVKLVAEVTGGEHAGSTAWVFLGLDMSKDGIKNIWQTALASMGFDPAALNQTLTVDTDMLLDKNCYLRVTTQKNDDTKFNRNLVTREEYERAITKPAPVAMNVTTTQRVATSSVTVPTVTAAASVVPQPAVNAAKLAGYVSR